MMTFEEWQQSVAPDRMLEYLRSPSGDTDGFCYDWFKASIPGGPSPYATKEQCVELGRRISLLWSITENRPGEEFEDRFGRKAQDLNDLHETHLFLFHASLGAYTLAEGSMALTYPGVTEDDQWYWGGRLPEDPLWQAAQQALQTLHACLIRRVFTYPGIPSRESLRNPCLPDDPERDEAEQALDEARRHMKEGDHAKSQERYEWFHANALRIRPSYRGVRLSYGIGEWVELGKEYPPALESLKKIRDDKTRAIESGELNRGLFIDVRAINQYLEEEARTIALFRLLDVSHPEFAGECFRHCDRALLRTREFDLYLKHAGDIRTHLETAISNHEAARAVLMAAEPRMDAAVPALENTLVETTLSLSEMMREKGDAALALELKSMTAKVVEDSRLMPEA